MKYHIPGKTFLLGEYSALVGGSVLGLATSPGFEVTSTSVGDLSHTDKFQFPFSKESPAGLLSAKSPQMPFQFQDRVQAGGFGRSTAEYLAVLLPQLNANSEFSEIKKDYQNVTAQSGAQASGQDIAIQFFGDVTFFNSETNQYSASAWKYPNLDFLLVATGLKVKTHEHVKELNRQLLKDFPEISNQAIASYFSGDQKKFVAGLNAWSDFLISKNLVHENSMTLKKKLMADSQILSAKPCGAMGADVLLVLCEDSVTKSVQHKISKMGLTVVATKNNLAKGILHQQILRGSHVG